MSCTFILQSHPFITKLLIEKFVLKPVASVCVACVPQEAGGNIGQTWAEGEDYSRKTLFVDLFQYDVMSVPLCSHLIITILDESLRPLSPDYGHNKLGRSSCSIRKHTQSKHLWHTFTFIYGKVFFWLLPMGAHMLIHLIRGCKLQISSYWQYWC